MIKRRSSVEVLSLIAGRGAKPSEVESDGEERPLGLTLGGLTRGGLGASDPSDVVRDESAPVLVPAAMVEATAEVAIGTFCGIRRRPAACR